MKFGLVVSNNPKAKNLAVQLEKYLVKKGQKVGKVEKGLDVVVTLGGDGTLLHAASRYVELGMPFVGINVGTLGFLTAEEADGWKTAIDKLIAGKYVTSERIIIEAQVLGQHSRSVPGGSRAHSGSETRGLFQAVNEIVVKGLYRVVDLEIYVSGRKFLEIVGDGVIVATQTGSTAYSLSSGGPIVDPDLDCLLVTPINPIGLPIPSVVLSPHDVVEIKVLKGDDVSLIADGQEHVKISQSQSVKVKSGEHKVKFIFFDEHQFVSSLEAKFGLGSRVSRG